METFQPSKTLKFGRIGGKYRIKGSIHGRSLFGLVVNFMSQFVWVAIKIAWSEPQTIQTRVPRYLVKHESGWFCDGVLAEVNI